MMSIENIPIQVEGNEDDPKVFSGILFKGKKNKNNKVVTWESNAQGRKTIRLVGGVTPQDIPHTVKVVTDSNPDDPFSGYYIAEIIANDQPVDWPQVDENVNSAEKIQRQLHKSKKELFEETGLTNTEREDMEVKDVLSKARRSRVANKALESEEAEERDLEEILGNDSSLEKKFIKFKISNLRTSLRQNRDIEVRLRSLKNEENEILRTMKDEPGSSELEALSEIREDIGDEEWKKESLLSSSPEAYYGLHLKQLKKYKDDLENGRIAETPYVVKNIEDIVSHLNAGKPVMIYGHLGSGKTELAMHVARNYILNNRPDIDLKIETSYKTWLEKNPNASMEEQREERKELDSSYRSALVISGSKNMSSAELYGHQVLDIEKIKKEELEVFVKNVESKYDEWVIENQDKLSGLSTEAIEHEKSRAHDRLLQTYLTQFKGGTISDFFVGPIYRAMAEGRPVIIDEVNAIPHELLISMNHILTRRVGDEVSVQQNSGSAITVKEGYGVIMTGNLNQGDDRYVDRQDMDPAFLSRVYKIEYDYLPQKTEGHVREEAGKENELFHLLISKVMDDNGNLQVPDLTIEKLWDLAKVARVTQNVFAGKETNSAYYFKEGGQRAIQYMLKESVLSMRGLDKIVSQWQKEGYKYELDYYLWKEFVSQSTNPTDKAYLYQLFKDQFGFFTGPGWEQRPDYGTGGVVNSFDINAPKNPADKIEFMGPRDTVDWTFGHGPDREVWPAGAKSTKLKEEGKVEEEEEKKKIPKKPEQAKTAESFGAEFNPFLAETYKGWGVDTNQVDRINFSPELIAPSYLDYKSKKSDTDTSKYGEYTLNPDTIGINWDSVPQDKIKVESLDNMQDKSLDEVAKYIADTYSSRYYIPGLDYYKYILENPSKAPAELKDGNYYFMFGSLFRRSDGLWSVPYVRQSGSAFERYGRWLGDGWESRCRVVLLEK